jgi:hypothetical protein
VKKFIQGLAGKPEGKNHRMIGGRMEDNNEIDIKEIGGIA